MKMSQIRFVKKNSIKFIYLDYYFKDKKYFELN